MKLYKGLLLSSVLAITFACARNDINETEEDFSNPKTISEEYPSQYQAETSFKSLPSAESLSNSAFIPDRIGFAFDSSDITSSQREILDAQIEFIKQNKSDIKRIVVSGYCDERGSIEYNYALGERRANSVKKYLVKNGISSSIISTVSYGKEVVLVEGSSEEAYRENRVAKVALCQNKNC
jgi:peptidoglycan-associated lipoprotein